MTDEELHEENIKSHKALSDQSFKRECRIRALEIASRLTETKKDGLLKNIDKSEILPQAENIYQWLVKEL